MIVNTLHTIDDQNHLNEQIITQKQNDSDMSFSSIFEWLFYIYDMIIYFILLIEKELIT